MTVYVGTMLHFVFVFVLNLMEAQSQAIVLIPRRDIDFRLLNSASIAKDYKAL